MENRGLVFKMVTRLGPPLLILISFLIVIVAFLLHSVHLNESIYKAPPLRQFDENIVLADEPGDLLWFIQLTDLHINIDAKDRERDLEEFAKTYIHIIHPQAVLVTGDITDGRFPNTTLSSGQQFYDWSTYSSIIKDKTNAYKNTLWLDIRGNHDNFNVLNPQDPKNLFIQHSVQGSTHPRNQFNMISHNNKNYTFIGVDEIQTPGLKVPFNLVGAVDSEDIEVLTEFKKKAKEANSQYTIWYGHYPTSSVESRVNNLKQMIDGPYLCGHYHTIGSWVTDMYANQQQGYTEAELGDWKNNRYIRLAAIDHQLFSFVDFKFKQWPVALMTNPKNAHNRMFKYEPLSRIVNSTHVRVLAFSNATITSVEVSLAGQKFESMVNVDGPLYTLKTNMDQYSSGIVDARIKVVDESGKMKIYNQTFSLDLNSANPEMPFLSRMFIRFHLRTFTMILYLFAASLCVLPMLLMRIALEHNDKSCMSVYFKDIFLYKIYMLSKIDRILYPLLFIPLYMTIGPQFYGNVVEDAYGTCFVWGIYVQGRFVYTVGTYNASSLFLLTVHIPTVLLISKEIGDRYAAFMRPDEATCCFHKYQLFLYAIVVFIQLAFGWVLLYTNGILAYSTSFLYLWSLLIYVYCWLQTQGLTRAFFVRFKAQENGNPLQEKLITTRPTNS